MKAKIRKLVTAVDEIHIEMGKTVSPPTRRAVAAAIIENPFAGKFQEDLSELTGMGEELGDHANAQYEALILDGFVRPTFIEVPNIGHQHPDVFWFEKAV